jgi:hypothetical protein
VRRLQKMNLNKNDSSLMFDIFSLCLQVTTVYPEWMMMTQHERLKVFSILLKQSAKYYT